YFLSGLFIALALFFKQLIALVFCAVLAYHLLTGIQRAKISSFIFGFSIPILFLSAYIFRLGIWKDFYYWTYVFNREIYPKYAFRLPTGKEIFLLGIVILPVFF